MIENWLLFLIFMKKKKSLLWHKFCSKLRNSTKHVVGPGCETPVVESRWLGLPRFYFEICNRMLSLSQ